MESAPERPRLPQSGVSLLDLPHRLPLRSGEFIRPSLRASSPSDHRCEVNRFVPRPCHPDLKLRTPKFTMSVSAMRRFVSSLSRPREPGFSGEPPFTALSPFHASTAAQVSIRLHTGQDAAWIRTSISFSVHLPPLGENGPECSERRSDVSVQILPDLLSTPAERSPETFASTPDHAHLQTSSHIHSSAHPGFSTTDVTLLNTRRKNASNIFHTRTKERAQIERESLICMNNTTSHRTPLLRVLGEEPGHMHTWKHNPHEGRSRRDGRRKELI